MKPQKDPLRNRTTYKNCKDLENARRREQIKSGKLRVENGLEVEEQG